jgi:hypothetical protein
MIGLDHQELCGATFGWLRAEASEWAFICGKSGGFRDLNTRIASGSGWTLESANSIKHHGEIVRRADYKGQDDTGFLLIPER